MYGGQFQPFQAGEHNLQEQLITPFSKLVKRDEEKGVCLIQQGPNLKRWWSPDSKRYSKDLGVLKLDMLPISIGCTKNSL